MRLTSRLINFTKAGTTSIIFSFSFFSLLLAGSSATAQEQRDDYTFRIKVAASKTPISKTSKLHEDFPDLEAIEFPDGYIRYFVGKYETFHLAKEALPSVREKGCKDAYVVCIHAGKILTVDEAIMEIYEGK